MGDEAVLTLAQATTETTEETAEPTEAPTGEATTEEPAAEAATVEPTEGEAEAGVEEAEEGLIETIIDTVTEAVEDVVPGGEGEDAAEGEEPGEAAADAGEDSEESLIETIIDTVTEAVEDVVPGGEGEAEEDATTETVGVAEDHGEAAEAHDEEGGVEIYLVLALVLLILIAYRPAKRAILGALDKRADGIRGELEEAKRLREEAQAALANFQRRQRDALGEAEEIIAHARAEAGRVREHAAVELEETLKRREAMAIDRIAQAEAAATAEVRDVAVDVAITAARQVIGAELDKSKSDALVDDAIKDLPGKLH